jgi:hypothetical protein
MPRRRIHAPAALTAAKEYTVPIVQQAVRVPEPVWMRRRKEWITIPAGNRTPAVQPVAYSLLGLSYPGSYSSTVKIKFTLCFNSAPSHEGVLGEWKYRSTHSLTSALDGGDWSASSSDHFNPRERVPGTHWIGGWVGPRVVLDVVVKRKIPNPHQESNPRIPIVQPVAQRYTDWATTAL